MIGVLRIGVMAILCLGGCTEQKKEEAINIRAQMLVQVQPAAQVFWNAVQYISDERGEHEIVPQSEADWNRVVEAARTLKKLGEELKQPAYSHGRGADWQDFAQGMVDVAGMAEAAARSKQPAQVLDVGGTIYNVCSACHEVYMPSPGGSTPANLSPMMKSVE